ncbi:MAG: SH3 domain-containing protein [Candidatus Glassbacteria bacterium]
MPQSIRSLLTTGWLVCLLAVSATGQTTHVQREARLLEQPRSDAVVLDVLTPGMTVEVVDVQGNWASVRLQATSEMGWVETQFLSQAPGGAQAAAGGQMTDQELQKVRERVGRMNQNIDSLGLKVEGLLMKVEGREEMAAPPATGRETTPGGMGRPSEAERGGAEMEAASLRGEAYHWRNAFYMGQYLRGGQNFFGLSFTRLLDGSAHIALDGRAQYALGEVRGAVDDFIDWTLGLNFNLFPQRYRIYPYFGAHFGMRNLLEDSLPRRNFFIVSPACGITAELSSIFSAGAEIRGVFMFQEGIRRDEGTVSFFIGYCW